MLVKTILNKCYKFKSFVYGETKLLTENDGLVLHVQIHPRKNGWPICSMCDQMASIYDTSPNERKFEFIPIWGVPVFFLYKMRRVNCPSCGVKTEKIPWSDGKNQLI